MSPINLNVNGVDRTVSVNPMTRLSRVLRNALGLTGTKVGCGAGDCGACTVNIDGEAVCSCMVPVGRLEGASIETVESLETTEEGRSLQESFLEHGGAQCGFCTPGMLMASNSLLAKNPEPCEEDICDGLGGVLCRCTGYRDIIDSVADARNPERASSQPPPPGEAVGTRIPKVDGPSKVTGRDSYGDDNVPAGALQIRVIRSPYHRASFTLGNLADYVTDSDGVRLVLTADDVPGVNRFGVIGPMADQPVFAAGSIRFFGEAVAAVVVEPGTGPLPPFPITWTEQEPVLEPSDAMEPGAPQLHEDRIGNVLVRGLVTQGDLPTAMDASDVTTEGQFRTSFVEHAYIEPEAGWAEVTRDESGRPIVSIHVTTQAPFMDRADTAAILGVEPDRVVIRPTAVGGGFGGKLDISIQPILALAATTLGVPVRLLYSRSESISSTTKRHPAEITAKLGATSDGLFTALSFEGRFNTGAYASWGPTVANRVPIHASGPYNYRAYDARSVAVHTNCAPSGAFRGFGVPQAAIAQETLVDEIAYQLGLDPLEIRLTNALRAGQPTVTGQVFESAVGYDQCLEALREPYREASDRVTEFNRMAEVSGIPRRAGVGVAGAWYGCGNTALPNPSTIKVGLGPDGKTHLHQGAVDIGQGSNTIMSQMCADVLGIAVDDLILVDADTDHTPDAGKTSASRQTYVSGNATVEAALALRNELARVAGLSPSAVETASYSLDGAKATVSVGTEEIVIDLAELTPDAEGYVAVGIGSYDPPTKALDENGQGDPYAVFGFGAQVIELDVDTETGRVHLHSVDAAFDVGKAINPAQVEGQIVGGVAQGIGLALMEEFVPGRTNNLHDYLIPTIGDIPEVRVILIESGDPLGPFGAKGVGEHSLIPTPPAVLNAIRQAIGVPVRHVPATPERILDAIRSRS